MTAISIQSTRIQDKQMSITQMIVLHLLPGALAMLLMLIAGSWLKHVGLTPSLPIIFSFIAPVLIIMQLGFLYYKGRQLNKKFSLQGIVLYRDHPMPWWKTIALSLPLLAWFAIVWFIIKPPINEFFIEHFFRWMPVYFFDEYFLNNLNQYSPAMLRILGVLFTLSISFGGAVEELYFRGYLLPRMESLGAWAPLANSILFSLYHFWSPWENIVRLLALLPWFYTVWRTRNIYLAVLVHFIINAFSGISLLSLIIHLT
jgi:membrane protease YdiL (CAAX protease family)